MLLAGDWLLLCLIQQACTDVCRLRGLHCVCVCVQLRRAPGCTELLYLYDGDRNGVCWHLGTACGTQPWVNPVLAGRLAVRASSPACRSTDPKALAGHGFARCNFAGPRMEGGQLSR
jgi:hypothetical protein